MLFGLLQELEHPGGWAMGRLSPWELLLRGNVLGERYIHEMGEVNGKGRARTLPFGIPQHGQTPFQGQIQDFHRFDPEVCPIVRDC
jgi:hypothetical protein